MKTNIRQTDDWIGYEAQPSANVYEHPGPHTDLPTYRLVVSVDLTPSGCAERDVAAGFMRLMEEVHREVPTANGCNSPSLEDADVRIWSQNEAFLEALSLGLRDPASEVAQAYPFVFRLMRQAYSVRINPMVLKEKKAAA